MSRRSVAPHSPLPLDVALTERRVHLVRLTALASDELKAHVGDTGTIVEESTQQGALRYLVRFEGSDWPWWLRATEVIEVGK